MIYLLQYLSFTSFTFTNILYFLNNLFILLSTNFYLIFLPIAAAMDSNQLQTTLEIAARAIQHAKAIVITAGAGMGVDSGLPDFRGPEGFWRAYPPLKERGLTLPQVSTPAWFRERPPVCLVVLRTPDRTLSPHTSSQGIQHPVRMGFADAKRVLCVHLKCRRPLPEGGLRPQSCH